MLASCAVVPVTVPGLIGDVPGMLARGPLFLRWGYLPRLVPWLGRYLSATPAAVERVAAAEH